MTYGSRVLRMSTVLAAVLVISASAVWGAVAGKLAGVVKDAQTGDPLPNANIVLVDSKLGTVSDEKGRFFVLNVPPGTYSVRVTYIGYTAYQLEEVRISADLTTNLDVKMVPSDIQVEEVVIKAERPIIDQTATNAVRIVGAEDLEIMPFRGVQNVFALQPGVVETEGTLHIRGSRSDEIGYYVEGANVRNVVTGNSAVGVIPEALAEIQLQAGGFNAEYGGANAGIILHDLRTGGPQWSFSLNTESDNFTSKYKKRLGTYSYGYSNQVVTANGPVLNERIRAFLAGQRSSEDSDPVYWSGFEFHDLVDTGDRGGGVHWAEVDGETVPDTVRNLVLKPGNVEHTGNEQIDLNGTLLFDYNPIQLRVSGLYTDEDWEYNPSPVRNLLNKRLPEGERSASLINVKGTHILDPSLYYEVNFSIYDQRRERFGDPLLRDAWWAYNDSVAVERTWEPEENYTPYTAQGSVPRAYDLNGFPFNRPGTPTSHVDGDTRASWYTRNRDTYWGLSGSLTKQTSVHQFRMGADYQKWTARLYTVAESSIRAAIHSTYPELDAVYQRYYDGDITVDQILDEMIAKAGTLPDGQGSLKDLQTLIRVNSSTNFYGFDEFAREDDDPADELQAPRHPVVASAYLQDKIEYQDLIVNAGLRYEYFYADSWRLVDPGAPKRNRTAYTMVIEDSTGKYMEKTAKYHEWSPRLGFSFPVSDVTVFHAQYGRFAQMPAMADMFQGGARLALFLGGQNYIRFPAAFDIEPIRTTQYEIGFEQQFTDVASFDITGFYRDVKGQLQIVKAELGPNAYDVGAYNYYQNGDFATTKGMEFVLKLRRTNRVQAELNYTLSDARGTGSSENEAISGVENATKLPTVISPLDYNETHRGNVYVDYRFAANEGGPVFSDAGANLLFHFTSGHNYTLSSGGIGQRGPEEGGILADDDPRNRKPLESVNKSVTPWTFQLDLKLDKGFGFMGLETRAYAYVQNLLNRKNVINVYQRTGNAQDDGFLTDPDLSAQIVQASGGDTYRDLYEAINLEDRQHYWFTQGGDIYGEPRQIRFGLKFSM
ncbi:MAG: TonB-dependent receptor [Candidatus Latescibacterota bacterium]